MNLRRSWTPVIFNPHVNDRASIYDGAGRGLAPPGQTSIRPLVLESARVRRRPRYCASDEDPPRGNRHHVPRNDRHLLWSTAFGDSSILCFPPCGELQEPPAEALDTSDGSSTSWALEERTWRRRRRRHQTGVGCDQRAGRVGHRRALTDGLVDGMHRAASDRAADRYPTAMADSLISSPPVLEHRRPRTVPGTARAAPIRPPVGRPCRQLQTRPAAGIRQNGHRPRLLSIPPSLDEHNQRTRHRLLRRLKFRVRHHGPNPRAPRRRLHPPIRTPSATTPNCCYQTPQTFTSGAYSGFMRPDRPILGGHRLG